jgi:hypothetical protein
VIGDTVKQTTPPSLPAPSHPRHGHRQPDDVRLDVSGVSLASAGMITLVITSGASGVLVRGILMEQGGNLVAIASNRARVRVVASVSGNATVDATVGSTALLTGVRSPTIGTYLSLPSGSWPVSVMVNGKAVAAPNLDAAAGSDYTLLVTGLIAPTVQVITENNRLPAAVDQLPHPHGACGLQPRQQRHGLDGELHRHGHQRGLRLGVHVEVPAVASAVVEVTNPLALKLAHRSRAWPWWPMRCTRCSS